MLDGARAAGAAARRDVSARQARRRSGRARSDRTRRGDRIGRRARFDRAIEPRGRTGHDRRAGSLYLAGAVLKELSLHGDRALAGHAAWYPAEASLCHSSRARCSSWVQRTADRINRRHARVQTPDPRRHSSAVRGTLILIARLLAPVRPRHTDCRLSDAEVVDDRSARQGSHQADRTGPGRLHRRDVLRRPDRDVHTIEDRVIATGNVVFTSGTSRIAAERLEFNTGTKTGTFYKPPAAPRCRTISRPLRARDVRQARKEHVRDAGGRRLLLRREDREGRREEIPDHQRRLHDLRAADAALAAHVRHGHPEPRTLRAADQRADQGEGRADAVPADLLLPGAEGRPRDGLPDADLRRVHDHAGRRSATRSSGRSTAARTRRSCTTGSRRPARAFGGEYRYIQGPGSRRLHPRSTTCNEHEATIRPTASRRRRRRARATRSTAT